MHSLAFVPRPIAQKAQAEQGVNNAPAGSEPTLLVKQVVCQPLCKACTQHVGIGFPSYALQGNGASVDAQRSISLLKNG